MEAVVFLLLVCSASSEMRQFLSKQAFKAYKRNYVLGLKVTAGKRLRLKVNSLSWLASQPPAVSQSVSQSISQSASQSPSQPASQSVSQLPVSQLVS